MLLHITNLIWSCPAGRVYWNGNCDLYLHAQSWGVRNGPTHSSPGWGFWDWMFCSTREALKTNWPNFLWQIPSDVMNSKCEKLSCTFFFHIFLFVQKYANNAANSMTGQIYMSQKRSRVDFFVGHLYEHGFFQHLSNNHIMGNIHRYICNAEAHVSCTGTFV